MRPDIIIPTCKSIYEIAPLMSNLEGYAGYCEVVATCRQVSAAANRNAGLAVTGSPIVIMVDDDIAGFYEGWWEEMIKPLDDPSITMVSARLLKPDGSLGTMMFVGDSAAPYLTDVPRLPTACVAFRRDETRFNEGFVGSGFEDDDFCARLSMRYPGGRFVINNRVRLIHVNEMKNQKGETFDKNKALFDSLWCTVGQKRIPNDPRSYYSEHGQDHWLNFNIFKDKREGVFFEAGAIEGTITSNSLFFEKELGWTGLLAEADPSGIDGIRKYRPGPAEWCALWDKDGEEVEFTKVRGGLAGWSGVSETIEPQHADRIRKNISNQMIERIKVPTMRLDTLLKKHGLKKIDYLTLDIEGAEYRVLQSFPFSEFDIDIFDIENNFGNHPIDALMTSNGYRKIIRLGVSDIYRRNRGDNAGRA